ncbi:hypothetical protein PR202_gb14422 [Eleusine coracana subsp. coracana]|uniref:DUF2283 domain-containing protein n=1 Tax=Eleusine coracana subsp. coracana TaxID=191504 RepID=A0AAV5EWA9_ELECO|nr:hypothetical protein PR202_gb14422 [Eleusine coracana subsp. coracana]
MESGNSSVSLMSTHSTKSLDMSPQGVDVYGLEIKGQRPVHVEYDMDGVGEEDAVIVQLDADGRGRLVTAVLPSDEVESLHAVLGTALQLK